MGCSASVARGSSSFILPAELSECQGKLQELHRLLQSLESLHRIPSAPVIPTHQVRSRGGGRLLPRGLSPACCLHSITFLGQVPSPPYITAVFRRATYLPSCLSFHIQTASGLSLCSVGMTPSSWAHASARGVVFFLWDVSCLCALLCGHLPLSSFDGCCPFPHPKIETPLTLTCQASVTTERPKKGKRTSRMWCTQSFAKDDTIGRVRWGVDSSDGG